MKITGIITSPIKTGSTAWVINTILEGAKEKGAETQPWYLGDLDIKPCKSCYGCKKGNRGCIVNDDMQQLYGAVDQADTLILGSPVYMWQMNAQAKLFTDRLFARFSHSDTEYAVKKNLVLVFTQGNPDAGMFKSYFDYTKDMFQFLGYNVKDLLVIAGTRNEPVQDRKALNTAMKELGASLV